MTLYTSDGCSYFGMDEQTVINLRQELGYTTEFVTQEQYEVIMQGLLARLGI